MRPIVPNRRITGMSAVLLPFTAGGALDWDGFEAHVERTARAGPSNTARMLSPALLISRPMNRPISRRATP